MSTTKTVDSLGLKFNVSAVPTTPSEFDANAKRDGACVEEAVNNVIYRSVLAEAREKLVAKLQITSGIEREHTEPDESGDYEWTESEAKYVKRVTALKGGDMAQFQPLADEISKDLIFDASKKERAPAKPRALAKRYLEFAQKLFDLGKHHHVAKKLGLSGEPTVETLAAAIKADQDAKAAAMEASYMQA